MMNSTSRMTALLGAMRRERNGAVADAMHPVGTPYGLNYGVSLPTLRQLARAEAPDYEFAKYLALQDVRELRLAAYHIADPDRLTPEEFSFWAEGIVNSELAEEAAFALLHRIPDFGTLFRLWTAPEMPWTLRYAALMAASRRADPDPAWIDCALDTVHRAAESAESAAQSAAANAAAVSAREASLLIARGAVALLVRIASRNGESRQAVLHAVGSLGRLRAEDYVHEELAWQLDL